MEKMVLTYATATHTYYMTDLMVACVSAGDWVRVVW